MFLRKGLTGVMDYVSENHSKYLLMVRLIFVVKYRRNLPIKFGDEIKQIFYDVNVNIFLYKKWKIIMYNN